jgi:hypothetical protein
MNALQDYIQKNARNETELMNALQDHGIISDNCVTAEEVADTSKAIAFLESKTNENYPR